MRLRDSVNHWVGDPFGGEQDQREDGEGDLKALGI